MSTQDQAHSIRGLRDACDPRRLRARPRDRRGDPAHLRDEHLQTGRRRRSARRLTSTAGRPTRPAPRSRATSRRWRRERGFAFASGLAAEDTLVRALCRPGDHVVIPDDAYGGTFRLFDKVEQVWGWRTRRRSPTSSGSPPRSGRGDEAGLGRDPTNPLLNIGDITALAAVAHDAGALLVVDNTFASPYLQQPLTLGADVVVHSTTKYCGGHPTSSAARWSSATSTSPSGSPSTRTRWGAVAGPFDSWLTLRGLKTLALRMDRHCDNAERVVDFLTSHPGSAR